MEITSIVTGKLRENCYLVEKNGECLLIDPGDDYEKILKLIENKKVLAILITHYHQDHTASLDKLVSNFSYSVFDYRDVGTKKIGNFSFEIIPTFGHTDDSVTYYFKDEKVMFTGDFLFFDTIGRCDFENSSVKEMQKSVTKIKKYDDNITVYPGHGIMTNLEREKKYNPYFQGDVLL